MFFWVYKDCLVWNNNYVEREHVKIFISGHVMSYSMWYMENSYYVIINNNNSSHHHLGISALVIWNNYSYNNTDGVIHLLKRLLNYDFEE